MSDITISPSSRQVVTLLQRTAELRAQTTRRLATGLSVERVNDDPPAFFQARALSDRAQGLLGAKDGIGQATSKVETALVGLDAIEDLSQQLKGIALSVRGAGAEARAAAAEQFDVLRDQITSLANDAGLGGTYLISESPGNLDVTLNETGDASLTINGQAADAVGLGIGTAATDFNGFAADADIDAAVNQLDAVIASIRARATGLGTNVAALQVRESFIDDLTSTLETGAAKLVEADLNTEAARLLSNELRQEIGIETLAVASRSQGVIADLLGG